MSSLFDVRICGDVGRVEIGDLVAREDNILAQPEGAEGMSPAQIWRYRNPGREKALRRTCVGKTLEDKHQPVRVAYLWEVECGKEIPLFKFYKN